jgi:hypothetical protein
MKTMAMLSIVLLMTVPASVEAQDAPSGDVVATSFAWPVGTEGAVTTYQRMLRAGDGTDSDIVVEGSYDFRVEAHDQGILVRHTNFVTTNFASVPALAPDNPLSLLYTRLGSITPNYVVSERGELLRVEGVEEMRDGMREVLGPLLDSLPDQAAEVEGMFQQVTSAEYLFGQLVEQWNLMVAFWIEAELEVGAVYEFEDQAPSPLFPQQLIPFHYEFAAAERVPCEPSTADNACIRFEFRSVPDPQTVADMVAALMKQLGAIGDDSQIEDLQQENLVSLIADPTNLLPYRWEMSQLMRLTGSENGARTEVTRSTEYRYEFSYR